MLGGRAQNKLTLCSLSCCRHKGRWDAPPQHPAGVLPSPASGSHGLHANRLGLRDSSLPRCWRPSRSWFASRQLLGLHAFIVGPSIAEYSLHSRGRLLCGASELVSGRGRLHRVIQRNYFPSPLKPYSENFVSEAILMSFETHITVLRPALYVRVWLCNNTALGMSLTALLLPLPSFLPAPGSMPVLLLLGWLLSLGLCKLPHLHFWCRQQVGVCCATEPRKPWELWWGTGTGARGISLGLHAGGARGVEMYKTHALHIFFFI